MKRAEDMLVGGRALVGGLPLVVGGSARIAGTNVINKPETMRVKL